MRTKQVMLAAIAAALVIGATVLPALAVDPPISGESLTARAAFVDDIDLKIKIAREGEETTVVNADNPSNTAVVRYTVQPGAQFPWHTHAGPVIVNIVAGALTYVDTDCGQETYTAGQAFVDAGHGDIHSAFNPTDAPTILVAVFFEAPATGPLVIPADPVTC